MSLAQFGSLLAVVFFIGMMLAVEAGRRIGRVRHAQDKEAFSEGLGAAEGAVFALMGLLVAFSFSGATTRFEERRHLITEEANDIGTAWLRLDLLPPSEQPRIRQVFKDYVDLRIAAYANVRDEAATAATLAAAARRQGEIWRLAIAGVRSPDAAPGATQVLLPALNAMFDIANTRKTATRNHPPFAIYVLLGAICLVGALLFGYAIGPSRNPNWLHRLAFVGVTALALYVILDLEFPRRGLIRIEGEDQTLVDVRGSMD
jgi:hypothetical protein